MTKTAIVTGGSSGLGRGIVESLLAKNMRVIAVARDAARLAALAKETGAETVAADVADEVSAGRILQAVNPDLLVLCAGASALLRPIHLHTWTTFSQNWEVDTKGTFVWVRDALLLPMRPGGHVITVSSAAVLHESPLSGGYAGAKRMNWWIASYAAQESRRLELNLRFHCLVPKLSPQTNIGSAAVAAYAQRAGVTIEAYLANVGSPSTPAAVGEAVVKLQGEPDRWTQLAYLVGGDGVPVQA